MYIHIQFYIDIHPLGVAEFIAFTADWSALVNVLR